MVMSGPTPGVAPIPSLWTPQAIPFQPAAGFGITANERAMAGGNTQLLGAPSAFGPSTSASGTQNAQALAYLSNLTGGAVSPSNDPHTWTPQQAAAQTDNAIARIGQANPELAQQLAEMHDPGSVQPQDGGGFLDTLKHAAASVLGLPGVRQAIDVISRPAHLLPELVHDWGKESVWKNVSDALMGRSDISWDDVLVDKFGMHRNILTAALGFVGDVATDPMTYLTFGAGGIAKEAGATLAAKLSFKSALLGSDEGGIAMESIAKTLASSGEISSATADAATEHLWKQVINPNFVRKTGANNVDSIVDGMLRVNPDAAGGMFHQMLLGANRDIYEGAIRTADRAFNAAATGGWARLGTKTAEELGIDKSAVDDALHGIVNYAGFDRKAYEAAKEAGSLLGGIRLRGSIPLLGLRWNTAALPFTSHLDFSVARRMFAGLSGEVRLQKMVGNGAASVEHLEAFWQGGFKGLHTYDSKVANELAGGSFLHLGSVTYPASEALGGVTAMFSGHAKVLRGGGLGEKLAADYGRTYKGRVENLSDSIWSLKREDGSTMAAADTQRFLLEAFNLKDIRHDPAALDDTFSKLHEYMHTHPTLQAMEDGPQHYFDQRIMELNAQPLGGGVEGANATVDELASLRSMQTRAINAERELTALGPNAKEAAMYLRRIDDKANDELLRSGIEGTRSIHDTVRSAHELNPKQAKEVSSKGYYSQQGTVQELTNPTGVDARNLGPDALRAEHPGGTTALGTTTRIVRDTDIADAGQLVMGGDAPPAWAMHPEGEFSDEVSLDYLDNFRPASASGRDVQAESALSVADEAAKQKAFLEGIGVKVEQHTGFDTPLDFVYDPGTGQGFLKGADWEALDAARAGGATHAPVRVRLTRSEVKAGFSEPITAIVKNDSSDRAVFDAGVRRARLARNAYEGAINDEAKTAAADAYKKLTGKAPTTEEAVAQDMAARHGMELKGDTLFYKGDSARFVAVPDAKAPEMLSSVRGADGDIVLHGQYRPSDIFPAEHVGAHGRVDHFVSDGGDYVVRDLRTDLTKGRFHGPATSEVDDVYAQALQKATDFVDAMDGTASELPENFGELSPYVQEIVASEVNRSDKIAALVTDELRGLGKDGIHTITPEGDEYVTHFMDETGRFPIARVRPGQPTINRATGSMPLVLTPEVTAAVAGAMDTTRDSLPNWLIRLQREAGEMAPKDAEDLVRRELRKKGVTLRPEQRVFETDPLKIAHRFVQTNASHITATHLGRAAQRLDRMGFLRSPFQGAATGLMRSRWVPANGYVNTLNKLGGDVEVASNRAAALAAELEKANTEAGVAAQHVAAIVDGSDRKLREVMAAIQDHYDPSVSEGPNRVEGMAQDLRDASTSEPVHAEAAAAIRSGQMKDVGNGVYLWKQRGVPSTDFAWMKNEMDAIMAPGFSKAEQDAAINRLRDRFGVAWRDEMADWSDEKLAQTFGIDKGTQPLRIYAVMNDAKDRVLGYRRVDADGSVTAVVADGAQGQGIGTRLLKQHWADDGVTNADAIIKQVSKQHYSAAGRNLNLSGASKHMEEWANATRKLADEEASKATMAAREGINAHNVARSKLVTESAEVRAAMVPVEDAANLTGWQELHLPGIGRSGQAAPAYMADEWHNAVRGFKDLNAFQRPWRQMMSWWKEWATYMFPGFHVRNIMGAWFNNWLGGVNMSSYIVASRVRRAAHEIMTSPEEEWSWAGRAIGEKDAKFLSESGLDKYWHGIRKDPTYGDLSNLLSEYGINAGHGRAFAEARVGSEHVEEALGKRRAFEKIPFVGKPYVKGMKGAGTMTENLFRSAAFLHDLRMSGGDLGRARLFTMMRHGDYQDLTDAEFGAVRDLIPFYKWMRTNTPLQIHQLFESPGKLLATMKLRNQAYTAMGKDYDQERLKMPPWMQESFTVPLPGKDATEAVMLDLPMADLYTGARDMMSSFLPTVRPFLESYVVNQAIFSGKPLEGKPVQLAPAFQPIGSFLSHLGMAQQGYDGSYYISDRTQNVLNIIPIFARSRDWMYSDPDRAKLRMNSVTSAAFGLGLRPVDQQTMTQTELNFYYNQVLPMVSHLRDMGYPLPTSDDIAATIGTTDQALAGLGITPSTARYAA